MRAERRYWGVAVVGALLALSAVTLDRPVLLAGAAGIGGWLLSRQFDFVRASAAVRSDLRIEQDPDRGTTLTDQPVPVTLGARLAGPSALSLRVESRPPVSMRRVAGGDRTDAPVLRLPRGESSARRTDTYESPVAGDHAFDAPTVTAADPGGLFSQRFPHGPEATVSVDPRRPRDVHVGEGGERGERVLATDGDRSGRRTESGLEFAELRKYVTGDPARNIDWKTTARMGEPYVREYESQSRHATALVFDHRASLGQGPDGATKLDYLRQVALAVARNAREREDPVGLYAVGDEGPTELLGPEREDRRYEEVRRAIRESTATAAVGGSDLSVTPATARRRADDLDGDASEYATTLRPYFEAADRYVSQLGDHPLAETVRVARSRFRSADLNVLFTDDTDPVETVETVKLLQRGGSHVLVFVAPSVLFEPGGLADFERGYARYLEFEEFRRRLERLDRVTAFEVGPGDRVDAVLDDRRRRAEP
ncbi:DUF58 domain-containing protein [Halorussus aquaticus]|uniref:DUF58 domain-containing protein n=1 Tax=Halorussus aquaticus TaxID=2953748 RepID=A0ABD5PZH8_9EURY|nr:DUF58 domain-containing protein [Halorussus aquaticus]